MSKKAPKLLYVWFEETSDGGYWTCQESIPTEAGRNWQKFHVYSLAGSGRARELVDSDIQMNKKK